MNRVTHLIGYWIRDLKDEDFCAPQEVVGTLAPDVRSRLAEYLDTGGVDGLSQRGYSWCRFFCDVSDQEMGSRELTDGCWSWPEGLSHYVRAHGIILPEEFIAHALANGSARRLCEERPQEFWGVPSSLDYWRKWCGAHRSPQFLERLRCARAKADGQAPIAEREYMQRRISEGVAHYGLGDERCIFAGCRERVLSGMKLCARHVLREDPYAVTHSFYAITPELVA